MTGFDNLPALQLNKSALRLMCFTLSPEYVASILKKIFYALENDEIPDMDETEREYFKELYPTCRDKAEKWIGKSNGMKENNPNTKTRKRKTDSDEPYFCTDKRVGEMFKDLL